MNAEMKKHLEQVVVAIANEDSATAKTAFHDYLRLKTQEILLGEEADEKEDKEDKEEKDDEDKEEKEDKKDEDKKEDDKEEKEDDKDEDKEEK